MFLGIEIGGTKLQLVLGGGDGRILRRERRGVDRERGGERIREQIRDVVAAWREEEKIEGVGVGFGGPVDWRSGRICCSHQIKGWADFELGEWLQNLVNAAVRIDNDANVACLGEAVLGAGRGRSPVFYVTLGSGVGGGLAVDGKIYHGARPGEAEIGHVRLDRQGVIVEERCSGWAVDGRIREEVARERDGILAKLCKGMNGGEARHLAGAIARGDELAKRILREVAEDLAFGLSHVVHLCHPEAIVLGGGLSLVGEPLRVAVEGALEGFIMKAFRPGPVVALAGLGEDAVPCGALLLAAQERETA
jgi:glucokinase